MNRLLIFFVFLFVAVACNTDNGVRPADEDAPIIYAYDLEFDAELGVYTFDRDDKIIVASGTCNPGILISPINYTKRANFSGPNSVMCSDKGTFEFEIEHIGLPSFGFVDIEQRDANGDLIDSARVKLVAETPQSGDPPGAEPPSNFGPF